MGTDLQTFKGNLNKMIDKGEFALPSTVDTNTFRNACIVAFQNNTEIRKCTPESVFTALRHIAGAGLMPDGREAAIVVYGDKAQAQPMVAGLRKIARNSGKIAALWDDVVYEGETIIAKFEDGVRVMEHVKEDGSPIDMMRRGGEIVGAYAAAKLTDGTVEMEPMTIEEIEKRRKASANQKGDKPTGIWAQWFSEMAKKTVIRALCKRLPMSTEDVERIMAEQEAASLRDVTPEPEKPKETLAQRLMGEPTAEAPPDEPPADDVEDAEVLPAEFDEDAVDPMTDEYSDGFKAHEQGKGEDTCPHQAGTFEWNNWLGGYRFRASKTEGEDE